MQEILENKSILIRGDLLHFPLCSLSSSKKIKKGRDEAFSNNPHPNFWPKHQNPLNSPRWRSNSTFLAPKTKESLRDRFYTPFYSIDASDSHNEIYRNLRNRNFSPPTTRWRRDRWGGEFEEPEIPENKVEWRITTARGLPFLNSHTHQRGAAPPGNG